MSYAGPTRDIGAGVGGEVAWMIERRPPNQQIEWWCGGPCGRDRWTTDPNRGIRFCREVDARAVVEYLIVVGPLLWV